MKGRYMFLPPEILAIINNNTIQEYEKNNLIK